MREMTGKNGSDSTVPAEYKQECDDRWYRVQASCPVGRYPPDNLQRQGHHFVICVGAARGNTAGSDRESGKMSSSPNSATSRQIIFLEILIWLSRPAFALRVARKIK